MEFMTKERVTAMEELYREMKMLCQEIFEGRKFIEGEGSLNARLVLVGEAPGGEEEKQGKPFVGKAGKNLNEFLNMLKLKREDIYITNVVKLRPFKINPKTGRVSNRPPNKEEVEFFTPFLHRELKIINPKYVVTLGNFALKAVTENKNAVIGGLHGQSMDLGAFKLFPLYHPASIIYNRSLKEVYADDVNRLGELINKER